jgi:hypothetical protein
MAYNEPGKGKLVGYAQKGASGQDHNIVTAAGWQQNVGQAMLKHNSKY